MQETFQDPARMFTVFPDSQLAGGDGYPLPNNPTFVSAFQSSGFGHLGLTVCTFLFTITVADKYKQYIEQKKKE